MTDGSTQLNQDDSKLILYMLFILILRIHSTLLRPKSMETLMSKMYAAPVNQYPKNQFIDAINDSIMAANSMEELYFNWKESLNATAVRTLFSITPFIQMNYWARVTRDCIYIENVADNGRLNVICILRYQLPQKVNRFIMFMGDCEEIKGVNFETFVRNIDPIITQHRDAPMFVRRRTLERLPRTGGKFKYIPSDLFPANMSCISDHQFDELMKFSLELNNI